LGGCQAYLIEYANVTKIANEMELTRGSISKICKRMLGKGLIESYQRSDNWQHELKRGQPGSGLTK